MVGELERKFSLFLVGAFAVCGGGGGRVYNWSGSGQGGDFLLVKNRVGT